MAENKASVVIGATIDPSFKKSFQMAGATINRFGASIKKVAPVSVLAHKRLSMLHKEVRKGALRFKEARKELDAVNRRLASGAKQTDKLTDKWIRATQEFEEATRAQRRLNSQLRATERNSNKASAAANRLAASQRRAGASAEIAAGRTAAANRARAGAVVGPVPGGGGRAAVAGGRVSGAARTGAGRSGTAAALAGLLSFGTAREVIKEERGLSDLVSIGRTTEEVEKIRAAGRTIMTELAGTTSSIFIGASYDVSSGIEGLTAQGVVDITRSAAKVAKVTKSNTKELVPVFGTMFNTYRKFFSDMSEGEAADIQGAMLLRAVQKFRTTGQAMKMAMEAAGPIASSMGVNPYEQMAVLGRLQNTMKPSVAGTSYRAMISKMARAQGEYKKSGKSVNFIDEKGAPVEAWELITEIKKIYGDKIDAKEGLDLEKKFGTIEAVQAILALMDQEAANPGILKATSEEFSGLQKFKGKGRQFIDDTVAKAQDDPVSRLEIVGQRVVLLASVVGDKVLATFDKIGQAITPALNTLTEFLKKNEGVADLIGKSLVAVTVGGAVLVPTLLALGGLAFVVEKAGAGISLLGDGFRKLGPAITGVPAKIGNAARGVKALSLALMANPWAWVAMGAIAAAFVVWSRYGAQIGAAWDGLVTGIQDYVKESPRLKQAWEDIKAIWDGIGRIFAPLFKFVTDFLEPVVSTQGELEGWGRVGEAAGRLVGQAFDLAMVPINAIIGTIKLVVSTTEWAINRLRGVSNTIKNPVTIGNIGTFGTKGLGSSRARQALGGYDGFNSSTPKTDWMGRPKRLDPYSSSPIRPQSYEGGGIQGMLKEASRGGSTKIESNSNNSVTATIHVVAPEGADAEEVANLVVSRLNGMTSARTVDSHLATPAAFG